MNRRIIRRIDDWLIDWLIKKEEKVCNEMNILFGGNDNDNRRIRQWDLIYEFNYDLWYLIHVEQNSQNQHFYHNIVVINEYERHRLPW